MILLERAQGLGFFFGEVLDTRGVSGDGCAGEVDDEASEAEIERRDDGGTTALDFPKNASSTCISLRGGPEKASKAAEVEELLSRRWFFHAGRLVLRESQAKERPSLSCESLPHHGV